MTLFKKGFTLGEMLICLGIISVVVAIMIPAAMSKKPAKNKSLFRKAYYNTEKIVYDLVNEENREKGFPGTKSGEFAMGTDQSTAFAYFDNTKQVKIRNGGTYSTVNRRKSVTGKYLCTRFAEKLNTSGIIDCNNTHTMPGNGALMTSDVTILGANSSPNFVTNDGVAWFMSINTICKKDRASCTSDSAITISLDVNGNNPPNTSASNDPDRFTFSFDPEGKMTVPTGSRAARYLKSNTIFKD